jgi:hypothetical protein
VSVLKKTEEEFGIKIHFSVETEPLGTGTLPFDRWPYGRSPQPARSLSPGISWARTTRRSSSSTRTSLAPTPSRSSGELASIGPYLS